jgi:hypothetical protein
LKQKIFAIFAIMIDDSIIYEPDDVARIMTKNGSVTLPPRVHILPWHSTEQFTFTFVDEKKYEHVVEHINTIVSGIDKEDPWLVLPSLTHSHTHVYGHVHHLSMVSIG